MTNLPESPTIARFIAPPEPDYVVTVTANEKALVRRGGQVVEMFSGGSRQVPRDAEIVVADLRVFRWTSDTASVSFALADRRSNVEELLGVNARVGDRITVSDVAESADLAALVRNSVAQRASERELSEVAERALYRYGLAVKSVRIVVEPPTPVITCVPPRFTSLHDAARLGETEIALRLIIAGADIDAKDRRGNTPLRVAIVNHKTETALALIAARADVNANGPGGNKLLHTAEWRNEIKVVLALIAAGADIHARSNSGNTALHTAGIDGETEVARILIAAGADIHARNNAGNTPLDEAIKNRRIKTAQLLRDAIKFGVAPPKFGMSLHSAAKNGKTKTALGLIVLAGVNVSHKNNLGITPLRDAIGNDQTETSLALIAARADIRANAFGYMQLHTAAWLGDIKVSLALIAASGVDKAYVNAKGKSDWTPLHAAGADGHTKIALDLVRAGADINAMDYDGNKPPQSAIINGHIRTAEAMIAAASA